MNLTDSDGHCPGGYLAIPCRLAQIPAVQRAAEAAEKAVRATGITTAAAGVGTAIWEGIKNSASSGVGDASCPACGSSQRMGQVLLNKNAESDGGASAGAGARVSGSASASPGKQPPNPNGKNVGEKHQKKVEEIEKGIRSRGLVPRREHMVRTPSGNKSRRFIDVVGVKGKRVVEMHQVGKQNKNGTPVSRERKALDDIEKATKKRPQYHPYNPQ